MRWIFTVLMLAIALVGQAQQIKLGAIPTTNVVYGSNMILFQQSATTGGVARLLPISNLVSVGRTLIVDARFGNDTNATRESSLSIFKTLGHAKTNAQTGDLIYLRPGIYTNNNILKNGVNYHLEDGAEVEFTDWTATSNRGVIDDRDGATTNSISGRGVFRMKANPTNATINTAFKGTVVTTNPATVLYLTCKRIEGTFLADPNLFGIVYIDNCHKVFIKADEVIDPWPNEQLYVPENFPDPGFAAVTSGIYWKKGEMHTEVDRVVATGYGCYALEGSASSTVQNWYHRGNLISSEIPSGGLSAGFASIYSVGASDNYKLWFQVLEIRAGGNGWTHFGPGKLYLNAQKLGVQDSADAFDFSSTPSGSPEAWLTVQKVSAKRRWLFVAPSSNPFIYLQAQQYEDTSGSMTAGFQINSGSRVNIIGGYANITNAIGILHDPTTNATTTYIDGLHLNVRGTTTNKWPVEVRTNGLVLRDCVLVTGISGTTNSIVATNTAQNVRIYGSAFSNTNSHPNITFITGTLTVDGDVQ